MNISSNLNLRIYWGYGICNIKVTNEFNHNLFKITIIDTLRESIEESL